MSRKIRTSITLPAPADTIEANSVLERIGVIERTVADLEAAFAEQVAVLRQDFDRALAPLTAEYERITAGLQIFANQNREKLLEGDGKTVKLSAGSFGWRWNPAKVVHPKIKEETIIERIKTLGKKMAEKYIRTKEELNKEALLEDRPEITGVRYSQKEVFFYEGAAAVGDSEAASNVVRLSEKQAA